MLYGNFVIRRDEKKFEAICFLIEKCNWPWILARNVVAWRKERGLSIFPGKVI
jgi:hypothetical protein